MSTLLDANACLRYLLGDIEAQAAKTAEVIKTGAEVTAEVLAECVYVLGGVYKVDRGNICKTLLVFLDEVDCARKQVLKAAFVYFEQHNLDFVDCILLAESRVNNKDVLTFDKKLAKALV